MCRYGCPKILITDQGREFVNEVSKQIYLITHTEHRITSAYHPQVCILISITLIIVYCIIYCYSTIRCNVYDLYFSLNRWMGWQRDSTRPSHNVWPKSSVKTRRIGMKSWTLFSWGIEQADRPPRSTLHTSCSSNNTCDCQLMSRWSQQQKLTLNPTSMRQLQHCWSPGNLHSKKENIKKAPQSQKETYDRKHVQSEISVGTKVWLENTAQRERKGGKMDPVWLGP